MKAEDLVNKFNEQFSIGDKVYYRYEPTGEFNLCTVEGIARIYRNQPVAFLEEFDGIISIDESRVDYSRRPAKSAVERRYQETIAGLKIALCDAIRLPRGIVPASAEGLITEEEMREGGIYRANKS